MDEARIGAGLERFGATLAALLEVEPGGADARWLVVAAPLLLLADGSPREQAVRLAAAAQVWERHPPGVGWGHSPIRLLVAAADVALGEDSLVVLAAITHLRPRLRAAHAPHVGIFEFLSLLLLRLAIPEPLAAEASLPRLVELAAALHHRHALLQGDSALVWAALVVDVPGTPATVATQVDTRFHQLLAQPGLHRSDALTAAHLLTLADAPAVTLPAATGHELIGRAALTLLPAAPARSAAVLTEVRRLLRARAPAPVLAPGAELAAAIAAAVLVEELPPPLQPAARRRWLRAALVLAGMAGAAVAPDSL